VENGKYRITFADGCEVVTDDQWMVNRARRDGLHVARIVLTCAHVHDRRPEAASLLNLAALCQRCHNRHDAKARAFNRRQRMERRAGQGRLCP